MTATRVTVVSDGEGFRSLEPRWNELFDEALDPNPFLSFQWLYCWWRAYRPRSAPHVVLVEDPSGRLAGIAPLMWNVTRRYGVRYRCLEFIGDGTHETDHIHFVLRRETADRVLDLLFEEIRRTTGWDVLRLNQVPQDSLTARRTVEWSAEHRFLCCSTPVLCLSRRLPRDYASLLDGLQARFRSKLRATRRKLESKYEVEFGMHDTAGELPDALAALFRNHESRWRARDEPGVFGAQERREFYRLLSKAFLDRGYLRFYYLRLDGQIVAQQYCFEHRKVVYLLQEGFAYAFAKENVGNMLRGLVFERLIGDGVERYDFLAGDSRNKRIWSDTTAYDVRLHAMRRNLKGQLLYRTPRVVDATKSLLKRTLPRPLIRRLSRLVSRGVSA